MEATRHRWLPWLLGACVAGSLALVALTQRAHEEDTTVPRPGGLILDVFFQHTDGRQQTLRRGDSAAAGMLRLRVSAPVAGRLAILAIGEGDAVRFVRALTAIGAGKRQMLPETMAVTGRGPERLVALQCGEEVLDAELTVAAGEALREAGGDPRRMMKLPLPCDEVATWYEKR
ncbi:MAG: hypothetical protein KIT31_17535 [Deltaproteobacteria bacterium]|nr:hypothetical protein [Deltaproteobacteria bacterium]